MSCWTKLVVPEGIARFGRVAHWPLDATCAHAAERLRRGFRGVEVEGEDGKRVVGGSGGGTCCAMGRNAGYVCTRGVELAVFSAVAAAGGKGRDVDREQEAETVRCCCGETGGAS